MRLVSFILGLLIVQGHGSAIARAADEIGAVVSVKNDVSATLDAVTRVLAKGDGVHMGEVLAAGADSRGEFRLKDDSRLALGPGASLVLDQFVYDASQGTPAVVLSRVKGAFRFLSGKLDHNAYRIELPLANLAVRGTVFDVYVDETGEAAVLLHDGALEICNRDGTCQEHKARGHVVRVGRKGELSAPAKWSRAVFGGVALDRAFPFLSTRLAIDPVRRLRNVVVAPVLGTGRKVIGTARRTIRKATRPIRRIFRRPRLF